MLSAFYDVTVAILFGVCALGCAIAAWYAAMGAVLFGAFAIETAQRWRKSIDPAQAWARMMGGGTVSYRGVAYRRTPTGNRAARVDGTGMALTAHEWCEIMQGRRFS